VKKVPLVAVILKKGERLSISGPIYSARGGGVVPMTKFFQILAAWVFAWAPIAAITAKGETVRLEDEKITFTLPDGWAVIPESVLKVMNAQLKRSSSKPSAFLADFKYGYQILGAEWFSFPYLLIRTVTEKGFILIRRSVFERGPRSLSAN
jgi:hypothetical protein